MQEANLPTLRLPFRLFVPGTRNDTFVFAWWFDFSFSPDETMYRCDLVIFPALFFIFLAYFITFATYFIISAAWLMILDASLFIFARWSVTLAADWIIFWPWCTTSSASPNISGAGWIVFYAWSVISAAWCTIFPGWSIVFSACASAVPGCFAVPDTTFRSPQPEIKRGTANRPSPIPALPRQPAFSEASRTVNRHVVKEHGHDHSYGHVTFLIISIIAL